MQQAYAQANEVVTLATRQAQEILDNATLEANNVKASAIKYTDDILSNLENFVTASIDTTMTQYSNLINSLTNCNDVIKANRAELYPMDEEEVSGNIDHSGGGISLDLI